MNIAHSLATWIARAGGANRKTLFAARPAFSWTLAVIFCVSLLALGPLALVPLAHGQAIKKQSDSLGLDLSQFDVPEVPLEAIAAPPRSTQIESSAAEALQASDEIVEEVASPLGKGGKVGLPGLPLPGFPSAAAARADSPMTLVAEYTSVDAQRGQLTVTASLSEPWHTYSMTQPPGGPKRSVIKLASPDVKLAGDFASDTPPTISQTEAYPGVPVEEHHHRVVWSAPLEFSSGFVPGQSELVVKFDGLVCSDVCTEVRETLVAKYLSSTVEVPLVAFRASRTHADITAFVQPAEVKPGGQVELVIEMRMDPEYHVYEFVPGSNDGRFKTLIVPTKKADLQWGKPIVEGQLHSDNNDGLLVNFHENSVQWRIPVRVPADAPLGEKELELALGYMTCTNKTCDPPAGALVTGKLQVVAAPGATPRAALAVGSASANLAAKQPNVATWIDFEAGQAGSGKGGSGPAASVQATGGLETGRLSLMTILFALMGGFILNFMPCVLPVIGLKVLGFIEQAGSSRAEVVKLNLAYVLGICAVMWTLAGVTVGMQSLFDSAFGWGQQFTRFEFKLAMATLVFAMALSFLGVWEIPIPGFATSYKSNQLMEREGLLGAFSKGLFTTILATPCSGPFLGSVFAVTVTLDHLGVFVVYTMVGLGMGLPFLLLCLNPNLVKVLPKPGAWMETLKEALSFPLLLTVVYFVAAIGPDYRIATFSTLIAVWFACWWIGKVPIYADKHVKVKTWSAAISVAVVWGMVSFAWLGPNKSEMPWEPYSATRLSELRQSGKTVMIDFTANWCFNCQLNTHTAIEVPSVIEFVKEHGVAPLLADKTEESPEIDAKLEELSGTTTIPFLVIYPADPAAAPIILNGTFTKSTLLEALKNAGPSKSASETRLTSFRE